MESMNSSHSTFPLDAAWRIDRERLEALLARPVRGWPVDIVDDRITNADLMAQMKELPRERTSALAPLVRVAYSQTAGRGRRGRPWVAQPGNALLFSIACVLPRPIEGLGIEPRDRLEALGIEQAHILGLSWGGILAQEFYRHYRQRVRSLVLADTVCWMARSAL